jgi:nitroreductase
MTLDKSRSMRHQLFTVLPDGSVVIIEPTEPEQAVFNSLHDLESHLRIGRSEEMHENAAIGDSLQSTLVETFASLSHVGDGGDLVKLGPSTHYTLESGDNQFYKLESLRQLFAKRRSCRNFSPVKIRCDDLRQVLECCLAPSNWLRGEDTQVAKDLALPPTTVPARFPYPCAEVVEKLSIFVLAQRLQQVDTGIYRFDTVRSELRGHQMSGETSVPSGHLFPGNPWTDDCAVIVIIAAAGDWLSSYVNSLNLALMEAGHALQLLQLAISEIGLGSCLIGGMNYVALRGLLTEVAASQTTPLCALGIGVPASKCGGA